MTEDGYTILLVVQYGSSLVEKIASIDRGWLLSGPLHCFSCFLVEKIASIDRGWLQKDYPGGFEFFTSGENSLD